MNILFLIEKHNSGFTNYVEDILCNIIDALLWGDHNIAVYMENSFSSLSNKNINMIDIDKVEANNCDIILIQNSDFYKHHEDIVLKLENIPHIFISYSEEICDQPPMYDSLCAIIKIFENANLLKHNYPVEIIHTMAPPLAIKIAQKTSNDIPKILFIPSPLDRNLFTYRKIIKTFNSLSKFNLTIWGDEYQCVLEECCNENIVFLNLDNSLEKVIESSDLVVGSNFGVYESLLIGRPYIVFGVRGLGGLITPDNYEKFRRHGFEGRMGGEIYDDVDDTVFKNEINYCFKNDFELVSIIEKNKKLAEEDTASEKFYKGFNIITNRLFDINARLINEDACMHLVPKVSSDYSFAASNIEKDEYKITRRPFGNTVNIISYDIIKCLKMMDGDMTVKEIFNKLGQTEEDFPVFMEIVKQLWSIKAIGFIE